MVDLLSWEFSSTMSVVSVIAWFYISFFLFLFGIVFTNKRTIAFYLGPNFWVARDQAPSRSSLLGRPRLLMKFVKFSAIVLRTTLTLILSGNMVSSACCDRRLNILYCSRLYVKKIVLQNYKILFNSPFFQQFCVNFPAAKLCIKSTCTGEFD